MKSLLISLIVMQAVVVWPVVGAYIIFTMDTSDSSDTVNGLLNVVAVFCIIWSFMGLLISKLVYSSLKSRDSRNK